MSLAHIRLIQTRQDAETTEYNVESPDFTKPSEWQPIGWLVLNKPAKRYEFKPAAIWTENKALPPEVYACDESERAKLLASKYRGFGWGAWAAIINGYASQFLNTENYPEKHPPAFFAGS
jgi:hypothetical protein